ncbi:hypothetical protein L4174_021080 [Photobacterium sp. CCB-ST2H9]|uniref:hypothetical protein n=1 Tax=Photobacterium sp. CCB-ST2H9 TaxID=2912855 RepID=UPI0020037460|nr:hypothetical protein [Photobacterium sp. CCB-ST2H9]UTM59203.1 hypothetical protein L4174_021080 [Photobacterium sp. CCB-ST2H9]
MNNPRFTVQVYIGRQKTKVSTHRLTFDDTAPGRAQLVIEGSPEVNSIVAVDLGWGENLSRVFLGYVERVQPTQKGWSTVFCRELAAVLYRPLPVIMRHPTLMQLLSHVSEKTGLQFVVPERAYSKTAAPCFYSDGNGYRVMDELATTFSVPDFFWQQQGNGQIFVGSWQDSYWADKPVTIPNELMTGHTANKSATIPCIPKLKPGALVNGTRLKAVEFTGTEVKLTWT